MQSEPDRPAFRHDAILDAAFKAFATYGFRRTTMDDIAQGVGMSRSALYLHYRNKDDIFRSLVAHFFDEAVANGAAELARTDRCAAETLAAAFQGYDGKIMEVVLGTPHGAELLDAGHLVSADQVAAGEARLHAQLTQWLSSAPLPAGLGPAEDLAAVVLAGIKGLKGAAKTPAGYRTAQRQFAQLLALALQR